MEHTKFKKYKDEGYSDEEIFTIGKLEEYAKILDHYIDCEKNGIPASIDYSVLIYVEGVSKREFENDSTKRIQAYAKYLMECIGVRILRKIKLEIISGIVE